MTTMPTVAKSLVPSPGLVVQNPAGGAAPTLFCLFSQDWITLQTFIAQAMQLPINQGDFGAKYGTFVDMQAVQDCVAAMKSVQDLSNSFGDPTALVKKLAANPAILQTDTAPDQLYVHIVWFALWVSIPLEKYPFGLLTMIVSLEAIFLSTFVMISQNRADARRQVFADQQYVMIQEEKKQNELMIEQNTRIEALDKSILALTTEVREALTKR